MPRSKLRFPILAVAVRCRPLLPVYLLVALTGCSDGPSRVEVEGLRADKAAMEAEVAEYRKSVERLDGEIAELLAENNALRAEVEELRLELEQAETPTEFVERIIERPAPRRPSSAGPPGALPPPGGNPVDPTTGLQVVRAGARATERNAAWWRFGWAVTIRNHSDTPRTFRLVIQFMDKDGFVLDDDSEHGLAVPAGATRTFRESGLVNASVAPRVESINPIIKF